MVSAEPRDVKGAPGIQHPPTIVQKVSRVVRSPRVTVPVTLTAGLALIIGAPYLSETPGAIVEAIGIALFIGCITFFFDRALFISEIQGDFHGAVDRISGSLELLAEHNRILESRFNSTMLAGVDSVIQGGTEKFLAPLFDRLESGDSLTVLETFLDNVRLPERGAKLYEFLQGTMRQKPNLMLNLIGLRYSDDTRRQILARAFLSKEMHEFLRLIEDYWDFVAELMAEFPGRVRAKEIEFLPSLAAFLIEKHGDTLSYLELKKPIYEYFEVPPEDPEIRTHVSEAFVVRAPFEVYYSPIISTSSHLAPYFYKRYVVSEGDDVTVNYINMCWVLGKPFSPDRWQSGKASRLFDLDYMQRIRKWSGKVK